jgi:hypothetical protein
MTRRWTLPLLASLLACNIEVIDPESVAVEAPRYYLDNVPQIPSQNDEADPTAIWAAAVRRNLAFLTDPALGGRRPGTEGAQLTTSAIISLFGDAGLIPSAPTLGWTTQLGVRAVNVVDPRLAISFPPAEADAVPETVELAEGLWFRHRGAAGSFHLPMEVVALTPQIDLADRLAVGVIPLLGEEFVDPNTRIRGIFDAVAHRRPGGCLLQLPPERTPELRASAQGWGGVEVQALALDSDPPPGLPVEGFVSPQAFSVLRRAAGVSGSSVDVSFRAEERWFEDANVVGRIAGRENPEQVVLVTANWDAGGLTPSNPEGGEAQAGSGLAVLLAVVERLNLLHESGRVPARSVVFVAAAGGSLGNLGLEQIAHEGVALPENIVSVVHLDKLDWTAPNLTVIGGHRSTIGDRVLELLPSAESTDHEPGFGHLVFDLPRVPRVSLTRRGGTQPDALDPSVPLTALANTARITFDLVWDLADRPELPEVIVPRVDDPEPKPEPAPDPGAPL